jgi:hypothetical protein
MRSLLGLVLFGVGCGSSDKAPDEGDTSAVLSPDDSGDVSVPWVSDLSMSQITEVEIGGVDYSASSRLTVLWRVPPASHPVVLVDVTDESTGLSWTVTSDAELDSMVLYKLKASTDYSVSVRACESEACTDPQDGGSASASTADEVWQLLGSGHSIDDLTNIISDSNAKAHAFVYGDTAPPDLRGRIQLYYGALGGLGGSLSVATSNRAADAEDESSYSDFTSLAGVSGLVQPESSTTLVGRIGTGQGVPLTEGMGGGIRLMFEAVGIDDATRILSLDSVDAAVGSDFHSGDPTYCSLPADYESDGGCHPTVEIGVDGDDGVESLGIHNARQQKVGVPTLQDWRWGGTAGTFMVFTTDRVNGCTESQINHGYAVFDGTSWAVQVAESGCPKLFTGVQAMAPLHLGGGTFKIQFGNPDETEGSLGDGLPFLGPKRIIFGDTRRTGDPAKMEFEDWDAIEQARDLTYLWPDGQVFDATAEGYIDDFVVLTPTFDVEHQVQFVVLTDGSRIPFTSVAILRNR